MTDVMTQLANDTAVYTMEAEFEYHFGEQEQTSKLEAAFDKALKVSTAELYSLGLRDVGIVRNKTDRRFWMSVLVETEGDYLDSVATHTWSSLRSAFHAAGIATPGWPKAADASVLVRMRSLKATEKD